MKASGISLSLYTSRLQFCFLHFYLLYKNKLLSKHVYTIQQNIHSLFSPTWLHNPRLLICFWCIFFAVSYVYVQERVKF